MGYKADRHPILKEHAVTGQWCREAAGVVPRYPLTQTAWQRLRDHLALVRDTARAKGTLDHTGIPPGWGGHRSELAEIQTRCATTATSMVEQVPGIDGWDSRAVVAITGALEIALNPTIRMATRVEAMRTVLEYTQAKPAKQTAVVVDEHAGSNHPPLSATDWLVRLGEADAAGVNGIVEAVKAGRRKNERTGARQAP